MVDVGLPDARTEQKAKLEGWLGKLGAKAQFQQRWVSWRDGSSAIEYRINRDDPEPKGSIPLDFITSVHGCNTGTGASLKVRPGRRTASRSSISGKENGKFS